MSETDILHELKELYHWRLDREPLVRDEPDYYSKVLKKFDIRKLLPVKNKDISEYYNSQLPWQFAVSDKKRTLLAVLLDKFLEIRHIRDEYQKPIGRTTIPVDENPKWRKLVWSSDGILVAFSSSNGELRCYNTLANLICSIPKVENVYDSNSAIPAGAAVSLFLLEMRTKSAEWPYELLAVDFYGNLRSYFISSTEGFQPYHTFSLSESMLTAALCVPVFNILVIASPVASIKQKNSDDVLGLSTWRILNDHPYYRLVKPSLENLYLSKPKNSWLSFLSSNSKRIVVVKMSVSSSGKHLACLYSCGEVIIWTVPQLSIYKYWQSQDLMDLMNIGKTDDTSPTDNVNNILLDLNWCSDSELTIILKNGSLVVSGIDKFNNLLARINPGCHTVDRQPEQLDASAKITNFCEIDIGVLLLNCKIKEFSSWRRDSESSEAFGEARHDESMSQAVDVPENHSLIRQILKFLVHFEMFQQQKKLLYIERIYSLMALKKITAAELYEQKINNENFEEALDFARLFNLNENRVYKKQWNSTCPVTVESIENLLLRISDKAWILRECCERIPETLSAAKALLDCGLQFTDFDSFLNCGDIFDVDGIDPLIDSKYDFLIDETASSFSKSQLQMLQLRKQLLLYLDALTVYKEIIEVDPKNKSYDGDIFKKIRNEPPLHVALHFARDGNARAVAILFQYYSKVLTPFWFLILDNIPESTPPSNYKELLPRFNDGQLETWETKSIRESDWSESGEFKDLIRLKSNFEETSRVAFPFSEKVTAEWYEIKIRAIIKRSGLIDYALELVNLAIKNNIKGLEFFKHNLLVLDTLMYELLIDNELSLNEIEKMSQFDQLMLLMSNTTTEESFLENISNVLLPFLSRCEDLIPQSRDELLNNYLKHLSKYDLNLPLMFFIYVSDKHEQDMFFSDKRILEMGLLSVYACQRVDQIEMATKIIQYLPECSDNNNSDFEEVFNLHSQLTELQLELTIMQLLQSYGIEKAVGYLHENKNNAQFQKDTLTAMVNTKINSRQLTREAISILLDDMAFVQENFFYSLSNQSYLRIFACTMLTVGRVDCIEDCAPLVLTSSFAKSSTRRPTTLSYDESVAIVIEAAQSYFNIAFSYNDPNISLAESCLSLIDSHVEVERERKLINVLKELYDFGVQIPPLKVRMSVNKAKIIEKVLKVKPKAYKNIDRLISLAKNLNFDDNSNQSSLEMEVLNCSVDAAFQANDYSWCSSIVSKLMNEKKPCWQLCKKLCECEAYEDLEAKQKLIKLALIGCSDKELVDMVKLRNDIERKILKNRLQNSIQNLQKNDDEQQPSTSEEPAPTKPTTMRKISTKQFPEFDKLHELISIPSFVNMLHSSSSNVLGTGISLWRTTFASKSKDNLGESESNLNADCAKLGFPEFYQDVHERCKCICFLDKKSSDNDTQILQLLLRYHLLSQGRSDDVSNAITTNIDDVIAQLGVRSFPRDCYLCLCFMLLLRDDQTYSSKIFETIPSTLAVEKFALFYYSIKVLLSNKQLSDSWFENTPFELIKESDSLAKSSKSVYVKEINKYQNLLSKHKNVIQLEDLGCGIDSERFFSDEIYKTDSILGLAMYEERDKLDLALSLGAEYGVAAEDIVLSHISSLFFSHNVTLLTERLKEPVVLDTLKQRPKYVAERIITDIYDGLYGCDYQVLLLYYALLNQVAENDVIHFAKPRDHIKMLRKLKTFSKTIDYKLLTKDPPELVDAIFPSLATNEVNNALNFLISLPQNLIESVSLHGVFETLFQKSLNSKVSKETIEKLKNYLKRFARIEKFNEACQELDLPEKYFREMQTALKLNDNKELEKIVSLLVLEPILTTDVLRIVIEFVPTTSLTDIITDLLKKELNEENNKLLLQRIDSCIEDNEYEKCWCNSLQSMLRKPNISENVALHVNKILSILELDDDQIYSIIELLHETRLILREWVTIHSRITIFDVANASSRLNLVREILYESSSFVQLSHVAKLLTFWPTFGEPATWDEDPWLLLLEKVLRRSEDYTAHDDEFKLVQKILAKRKFNENVRRAFFKHIEKENCNRVLLVCFCVLTKDEILIQSVHHDIAIFRQMKQLPKMIEEYVEKMQFS